MNRDNMNSPENLIRFWRDMELFSPQAIPAVGEATKDVPVRQATLTDELPWFLSDHQQADEGKMWVHHVYVGVYQLREIFKRLDEIFSPTEEVFDERPSGESAFGLLTVDQDGVLLPDETVLSSCAWGLGHSHNADSIGFAAFDQDSNDLREVIKRYVLDAPVVPHGAEHEKDPNRLRLGWTHIRALENMILSATGLGDDPLGSGVRIRSKQVSERAEDFGGDFLNSLLLPDLTFAAEQVASGVISPPLAQYISGPRRDDQRVDVRLLSWRDTLDAVGAQALLPARWPTESDRALALNQQLALGLAFGTVPGVEPDPLLAVNGPPGTGKTTLLRDVLANLVVRRADAIMRLPSPGYAFRKQDAIEWRQQRADGGNFKQSVWPLHPSLTGFEIVLASSNNRAVENVSEELPLRSAVGEEHAAASYLGDVARSVQIAARPPQQRAEEPEPVWGLLAARLGRRKNRDKFSTGFWWGSPPEKARQDLERWVTLKTVLARWEHEKAAGRTNPDDWEQARETYLAARACVDALIAEARVAEERLRDQVTIERDLEQARRGADSADESVRQAIGHSERAHRSLNAAQSAHAEARSAWDEHLGRRPNVWEWLATLGKASRRWSETDHSLGNAMMTARVEVQHRRAIDDEANYGLHSLREQARGWHEHLAGLEKRASELAEGIEADRERWDAHYPDEAWWGDEKRRARAAPWQGLEMNKARSELFLAALDLHEALLRSQPGTMRKNLFGVMAVLRKPPIGLTPEQLLAVWQVLFLVVPLVSTTFASLGRMFGGMPCGGLGWLLVDEAGQATPQAAVGGMWRSWRVLAVGDPLQLTPIVTLPRQAEAGIAEHHGTLQWALPSRTSVQAVADGTSRHGTLIGGGADDGVWVGAPLVVHRRCDDPMFTVSNEIAYDGMMIQGKHASTTLLGLPPSQWIHVPSVAGGGHGIQRQADRAANVARSLLNEHGLKPNEIIAIAPFRAMADAVKGTLKAVHPDLAETAGTVHTAQGREAAVVLFVLGGDKSKPGAMSWASGTPNLVNVAVSRAKQRLYVIGDKDDWASKSYFDVLSGELAAHRSGAQSIPDETHSPECLRIANGSPGVLKPLG